MAALARSRSDSAGGGRLDRGGQPFDWQACLGTMQSVEEAGERLSTSCSSGTAAPPALQLRSGLCVSTLPAQPPPARLRANISRRCAASRGEPVLERGDGKPLEKWTLEPGDWGEDGGEQL